MSSSVTHSMRNFSWHKKTRTLAAEVSELQHGSGRQGLWERRTANTFTFWIKNEETGAAFEFFLASVDERGEEVAGWRFRPVNPSCPAQTVLVIND